jgi:hypothetical protein
MRTALSSLVLSVLALGLAGEARAGVLSELIGSIPVPHFSLKCLEPTDGDTPASASARTQHERHEALPAAGVPGSVDPEHARTEEVTPAATPGEPGADFGKSARPRPNRWKALLPGALK